MSPTQLTVIVLAALVVLALVAAVWAVSRRAALRARFGPEYERVVAEQESRGAAERELRGRQRRHAGLPLTPLTPETRQRYGTAWADLQARFVDAPGDAVAAADSLVTELVAERGYPADDYRTRLAYLSVEHASALPDYRAAHEIQQRSRRGEAGTEELRQALVHYRALFADLLGEDPVRLRPVDDRRARPHTPTSNGATEHARSR